MSPSSTSSSSRKLRRHCNCSDPFAMDPCPKHNGNNSEKQMDTSNDSNSEKSRETRAKTSKNGNVSRLLNRSKKGRANQSTLAHTEPIREQNEEGLARTNFGGKTLTAISEHTDPTSSMDNSFQRLNFEGIPCKCGDKFRVINDKMEEKSVPLHSLLASRVSL